MTQEQVTQITLTLAVANFILTWGVALYMYLANKNKATNERINTLEAEVETKLERHTKAEDQKFSRITDALSKNSRQIQHLETTVEMAPTHHDLAQVYEAQKRSDEKLNQLIGENSSQSDILRLILNQITTKGMS